MIVSKTEAVQYKAVEILLYVCFAGRYLRVWERSCSVVECLIRDRGAAGSSLTGGIALCP